MCKTVRIPVRDLTLLSNNSHLKIIRLVPLHSNMHTLPAPLPADAAMHCSPLLQVGNLIPELSGTVETASGKHGKEEKVGIWNEWSREIWLPQKIAPNLPGKIPGAEAGAFNHRQLVNTWPQIYYR